jgi:hypothetical protein
MADEFSAQALKSLIKNGWAVSTTDTALQGRP